MCTHDGVSLSFLVVFSHGSAEKLFLSLIFYVLICESVDNGTNEKEYEGIGFCVKGIVLNRIVLIGAVPTVFLFCTSH